MTCFACPPHALQHGSRLILCQIFRKHSRCPLSRRRNINTSLLCSQSASWCRIQVFFPHEHRLGPTNFARLFAAIIKPLTGIIPYLFIQLRNSLVKIMTCFACPPHALQHGSRLIRGEIFRKHAWAMMWWWKSSGFASSCC